MLAPCFSAPLMALQQTTSPANIFAAGTVSVTKRAVHDVLSPLSFATLRLINRVVMHLDVVSRCVTSSL